MNEVEIINGTVEEVSFHNEENGFTVCQVNTDDELICAVGVMPNVVSGELVRLAISSKSAVVSAKCLRPLRECTAICPRA